MQVPEEAIVVPIHSDADILVARRGGRGLAQQMGFAANDCTLITAAISEVARNIIEYARAGEIVPQRLENGGRPGLCIIARDQGPGIADLARAMQPGFSTGNGLGLGLSGARTLMDEFEIVSKVGSGTIVTMTKWVLESEDGVPFTRNGTGSD